MNNKEMEILRDREIEYLEKKKRRIEDVLEEFVVDILNYEENKHIIEFLMIEFRWWQEEKKATIKRIKTLKSL